MGMDDVGPPTVHHLGRIRRRGGVQPVAVVVLGEAVSGADPVQGDTVDALGPCLAVTEADRAREHGHLVTGRGDVSGDALQLQRGPAREVGRVVGRHIEDPHSCRMATVPAGSSR